MPQNRVPTFNHSCGTPEPQRKVCKSPDLRKLLGQPLIDELLGVQAVGIVTEVWRLEASTFQFKEPHERNIFWGLMVLVDIPKLYAYETARSKIEQDKIKKHTRTS